MSLARDDFEKAWSWREIQAYFKSKNPIRTFHGPGEGSELTESLMIDRFEDHYWVTERDDGKSLSTLRSEITSFLQSRGALSAVFLSRPERGIPSEVSTLFGSPPTKGLTIAENGLRFLIKFSGTRHPGIFLDHAPLRSWLQENSSGLRVLNTFAYTGSLSVAAMKGGASEVVTLDLSSPTIEWAKENWALNGFPPEKGQFIVNDTFEYLPRLERRSELFDCVILDPPSFSRGKKGVFSTSKDLKKLHEVALSVLKPQGFLVTSINSANVSESSFLKDVFEAAAEAGRSLVPIKKIEQPKTFPWREGHPEERYLKGSVFRVSSD